MLGAELGHLQKVFLPLFIDFPEMSVYFQSTTQQYIPEDGTVN
jgi:hypothetical protein